MILSSGSTKSPLRRVTGGYEIVHHRCYKTGQFWRLQIMDFYYNEKVHFESNAGTDYTFPYFPLVSITNYDEALRFCSAPPLSLCSSQCNLKMWRRQKSNGSTLLDFRETANTCPFLCPFHPRPLLFFLPFASETDLSFFLKTDSASCFSRIFITQNQFSVNCIFGATLDVSPHSRETTESLRYRSTPTVLGSTERSFKRCIQMCTRPDGTHTHTHTLLGSGLCAVRADGGGDWWSASVQIKRL